MKILLTGANGFVAPYLAQELLQSGHSVYLTGRESATQQTLPYHCADLTQQNEVEKAVHWVEPDAVVHLAGISHVAPEDMARAEIITAVNVDATRFLCAALHEQQKPSTLLFVSTGLVFQPNLEQLFQGYNENSPLAPVNDYGWSKLAAESIVRIFDSSHLQTYVVRPFNHTGPGQDLRFVAPALAKRIIEAKNGEVIPAGNLQAQRDFSDVRDIVRAYRMILEQRPAARTFVLGSGLPLPILDIFNFLVKYSGKDLSVELAKDLLRHEHDIVFGDASLAQQVLGWKPAITLEQTLQDLYDHIQLSALPK